jgi:hypothetical protein
MWALAGLAVLGSGVASADRAAAAPVGAARSLAASTAAADAADDAERGDVILIKRRGIHPGVPPFKTKRWPYHGHRDYRGRHYHDGLHWYFWAPWFGAYLYYESYDACYRSCRRRGYGHFYCSDLCTW